MRRQLGDKLGIVVSLERLAALAASLGSPLRAAASGAWQSGSGRRSDRRLSPKIAPNRTSAWPRPARPSEMTLPSTTPGGKAVP